ncbi:MAG: 4-phosphoerythronate dehydrogenase [Ignavibacteriaceae bacterium]
MMNIIVDENISFAKEAFSHFGNVFIIHGREINNHLLKKTDALIVRSITKVDKNLLNGTPVKFVGTATIGTDHIDLEYLNTNNICFSDAKGCNADAVTEYVFASIIKLLNENNLSIKGRTIGIVGTGNIGSRIARISEAMGMKVFKNDPPLQRKYGTKDFVSLNEIFSCDIITSHVPLNKSGIDKTIHLFDKKNLNNINNDTILINTSRGPVADNTALIEAIDNKSLHVVLDVWENEPDIDISLLERVKIGTPHIAGYSLEGKVNGTVIIYNALCKFLGEQPVWKPSLPLAGSPVININQTGNNGEELNNIISRIYDIKKDNDKMKKLIGIPKAQIPNSFDTLRKEYPLRREFNNFTIRTNRDEEALIRILKAFRFEIEN